jgi:hypothetical protein
MAALIIVNKKNACHGVTCHGSDGASPSQTLNPLSPLNPLKEPRPTEWDGVAVTAACAILQLL